MRKLFIVLLVTFGCSSNESYCYYDNGTLMVKSHWTGEARSIAKYSTWKEARDIANEMNCPWKN